MFTGAAQQHAFSDQSTAVFIVQTFMVMELCGCGSHSGVGVVFFPLMFSSRVYVSIHGYALVFRVPIIIPLMMILSTARAGISKGLCLGSPTAHIVCKHCDRVYMIRQSHCVTVVVLDANSKVHSTLSFLPP